MGLNGLSDDEITALPLDRLAHAVLRDLRSEWNWRGWFLTTLQDRKLRDGSPQGVALAEAIQWLFNRDLITFNAAQNQTWDSVQVTRLGQRAIEEGFGLVAALQRLNVELVPALESKVRSQFLLGDYETAAFVAMKEVEIAVRERAPQLSKLLGADLMKQAFKEGGPLADTATEYASEVEARMFLYAGAIGLFKNPASHRRVNYEDPTEASEIILLADLLLRMLSREDEPTES